MPGLLMSRDELKNLAEKPSADVLVFSDSHGQSNFILDTIVRHPEADLALHLGDHAAMLADLEEKSPVRMVGVAGNCDGWHGRYLPLQLLIEVAGLRIFLTHGHLHDVKRNLDNLVRGGISMSKPADIILFGHTHVACDKTCQCQGFSVRLINPGSARAGGGHPASAALLRLRTDAVICQFILDQV